MTTKKISSNEQEESGKSALKNAGKPERCQNPTLHARMLRACQNYDQNGHWCQEKATGYSANEKEGLYGSRTPLRKAVR